MIVQLYRGLMMVYMNRQISMYDSSMVVVEH
jgi:hypothetical protein